MKSPEFRRQFWDRKILHWERKRYESPSPWTLFQPVNQRLLLASQILIRYQKGCDILDLGCGSGLLFSQLESQNFGSFTGVDISGEAIAHGKRRLGDRAHFIQGHVISSPLPRADCVVGLGLLDWLSIEEISTLADRLQCSHFLFSFSERRPSFLRAVHRAYTVLSYGLRHSLYIPQYFTAFEICQYLKPLNPSNSTPMKVIRRPELSFGALVTNLPLQETESI